MAKKPPRKSARAGVPRKPKAPKGPAVPGGGGMPAMDDMMGMVQQMQEGMTQVQESLADDELEATVGGGVVKVVASGDQVIKNIEIDPDVIDPDDADMLQDLIVAGVNEALRMAKEHSEEKMSSVTGGVDLGGLGGLLS